MKNPIFLKLELEHITNERLERLKHKHLTLIALEEDLLIFRVDKKWSVNIAVEIQKQIKE